MVSTPKSRSVSKTRSDPVLGDSKLIFSIIPLSFLLKITCYYHTIFSKFFKIKEEIF
ncbi:Uncharacterised protein [Streptococcus pneumoniae]|nr:Uncharacterised protein [Streptococcus pneumoniae]